MHIVWSWIYLSPSIFPQSQLKLSMLPFSWSPANQELQDWALHSHSPAWLTWHCQGRLPSPFVTVVDLYTYLFKDGSIKRSSMAGGRPSPAAAARSLRDKSKVCLRNKLHAERHWTTEEELPLIHCHACCTRQEGEKRRSEGTKVSTS